MTDAPTIETLQTKLTNARKDIDQRRATLSKKQQSADRNAQIYTIQKEIDELAQREQQADRLQRELDNAKALQELRTKAAAQRQTETDRADAGKDQT